MSGSLGLFGGRDRPDVASAWKLYEDSERFNSAIDLYDTVRVNENFEGSTHLLLFSNYLKEPQNIRVNWDTRMMWKLSRFFSLNITTNLIYDDTVLVTDKDGNVGRRVQFAQALQFGFTYTFASKK